MQTLSVLLLKATILLEAFIRHKNAVLEDDDAATRPEEIKWREADGAGKLDLLIDIDFRMASTGLYSDIVFPAATWYEKRLVFYLICIHMYMYSKAAVDCAWETKSDWDTFRTLAETVSRVAKESGFTEYEDIVAMPLGHDSPGEVAQPEGKVLDWSKGECEPIPGKTMPNLVHVKRDYSQIFEKYIALGPNIENKMGAHGLAWDVSDEYQTLYAQNGYYR